MTIPSLGTATPRQGGACLDANATEPIRPEARAAAVAAMDLPGNPSAIHAAGLVIRDLPLLTNNWRCEQSLPEYLEQNGIVAIAEIDTRLEELEQEDAICIRIGSSPRPT